jgi:trigger factor
MKRKLLMLGTGLCLILSLVACGNKKDDTENSDFGGEVVNSTGGAITSGGAITPDDTGLINSNVKVTLGQYKGIEVTVDSTEVKDEEVQYQLGAFNQSYGTPIKLTERLDVQDGDVVNIDYLGKIDGVAFDGGTASGSALTIGSGQFIPGFEEGLIGKKVGETVDITTNFPADYSSTELAGKEAIFTVTVNYIYSGDYEPLNDEIVVANDPNGNKTVAELKTFIQTKLKESKVAAVQNKKEMDILNKAIENATFTGLEQTEYDKEEAAMTDYYTGVASQQYGVDLETYLTYILELSMEEFKYEIKNQSEFYVRQNYLLDAIIKEEKFELSDAEYDELLSQYMLESAYTDAEQFVTENGGKELIQKYMIKEKARSLILDSAVVTE